MPFGIGTCITHIGKAMFADRFQSVPQTYLESPALLAMGVGAEGAARTASEADTALSEEVEPRSLGNEGVETTTHAGDTWSVTGIQTVSANRNIDEAALFDKPEGGNMFSSATFNTIPLLNGESVVWTWKVIFT